MILGHTETITANKTSIIYMMLRYFLLFSVLSGSIYAMNHNGGMMGHHSGNHTEHDEVNMLGLNGINTIKKK